MVTRHHAPRNDPSLPANVRRAREILSSRGWTLRGAARHLDYSWGHFILVMTGQRESRILLAAISQLPPREEVQS